jgi:hypothetical protein
MLRGPSPQKNTKIDLKETGWNGVDWLHLVQD